MFFHLLPGFVSAYTWVGLGADANWNTAANWSTNAIPGGANTAIFDSSCTSNCDPTINVAITVGGFNIKSTYAGTITQAAGQSVTIGTAGWVQEAGTFVGSNAAVNMNGAFALSGGAFTSTSATITYANHFTKSGGTYNANSGLTVFGSNQTIQPGGVTFYDVNFTSMVAQNLSGGTIVVEGTLTLDSPSSCCGTSFDNGTIQAKGNVVVSNYGKMGTALISISGSSSQTLNGAVTARLPSLEFASTGGIVTVTGQINVYGNYAWISGTVDLTASTLVFNSATMVNVIPGALQYNNVTFSIPNAVGAGQNLNAGTMTINGTLNIDGTAACCEGGLNNGTIQAKGNVNFLNNGMDGTAVLSISGGSSQTITGVATAKVLELNIASTGGTVSLAGHLLLVRNYSLVSGTVTTTGSTLEFIISSGSQSINAGTAIYNNVIFRVFGIATQDLAGSTMNVDGTLTINSTAGCCEGGLNNGNINASGNVVFLNRGRNGTAVLNYTGTANTTLTIGASSNTLDTTHNVAKTGAGTVTLVATTSFNSAGRNFSISSGTLDLAGFTFTVNSLLTVSAGGRLLCNGGTATAGSWSILGEISCSTGQGITWTGAGGDNLWSTAANWTNNTVPGASDIALFNNSACVAAQCDAQINSNLSVRGILLQSTYPGTLTQNATRTLTVGTGGYTQAGGTFSGGNAAVAMNGVFTLSGGTYTATSGTWTQSANLTMSGAPTFNHNSGSWTTSSTITISSNGSTFNNVAFGGHGNNQDLNGQTMIIVGTLTFSDTYGGGVNNGTFEARGNITTTSNGKTGSSVLVINGTGAQSLTGTSNSSVPHVQINKASGTLSVITGVATSRNWTWVAGTVDMGTSTLNFTGNSVTHSITPGSFNYYNVIFGGNVASHNLNGGTMIVTNSLTLADQNGSMGTISNGTVEARGDITTSNSGKLVTGLILVNGTGAQTITGNTGVIGNIQINKASGTLTLAGNIRVVRDWTYTTGTVDAGTSTIQFEALTGGQSYSITPGPITYNHINFTGNTTSFNLNGGTILVGGNLLLTDINGAPGTISNGTIEARGNITTTGSGKQITGLLLINGTGAQTFTGTAGVVGHTQINKASGTLSLAGTIRFNRDFTYTTGTVDAGTSTVQFEGNSTITSGAMEFNHVTFSGNAGQVANLNAGTLIINGNLVITEASGSPGQINNGTIEVRGNVTASTTYGRTGSALLYYTGATNGTLTWTAGSLLSTTHTVAKTGGASLLLGANASFSSAGRDFTITSGTLDLNGYDFNVNDVLTVGVGTTLKCNGGEITNPQPASILNSGTINCPGYTTYDFNWTGAGGDANWNTAGNWSGGVAPGLNDIVVFQDTYCGGTCNSTISSNHTVRGVRVLSPFTGTITQGSNSQFTVGARGYIQQAGIFSGLSSSINISNNFTMTGGTFTSTSTTFIFSGTSWSTSAGTFNPNSGTVTMDPSGGTTTINHGTNQFNNLNLYGWASSYTLTGTVTVNNHFQFGTGSGTGTSMTSGVIEAKGDVTMVNNGLGAATNSTILRINGNGTQTLTGTGGALTRLEINKASGALNLVGSFSLYGPFSYVAGTVNPGTSTFTFVTGTAARTHSPNGLTLANVAFNFLNSSSTASLNSQTLNTTGTVTFSSSMPSATLNSGTLNISGNAVKGGTNSIGGTVAVQFNGGADATLTTSGAGAFPGSVTINKPAASLILASNTLFNNAGQNLTISSGTLDMAGYNLTVGNNISNSGTLRRGTNPSCGTITQGGSFTGSAAICP